MQTAVFLVYLLAVTAPGPMQAAQRQPLGIFFGWGAFEEKGPRKCFAIAQAEKTGRAPQQQPYASIGYWPERGLRGQLHVRLSRTKRPGSAVILRIDGRSFQLLAGRADAWAPNLRADAAIAAAMRTGVVMTVESRSERGGLFRDRYLLRGAATAMDAAAIACARG